MVSRMRQQHPVVIRALSASLADHAQPWEDWRTAGTLIAFRPLVETPWLEEALREREEATALREEEVQSRIQAYEMPEVQGEDVLDLEDARAVVDRLKWATERIEELENKALLMEGAATTAADAHARAEKAEIAAAELSKIMVRPDFGSSAEAEAERLEMAARMERLERAIAEAVDGAAASRLAAEKERAAAAASEQARRDLEARLEALEKAQGGEGSTGTSSEGDLVALREELANVREEALEASALAHMASAVRHDVEVLKLQGDEAIALREEITRLRDRAEQLESSATAREERDRALVRDAEAARAEMRAALERVEALSEQAARLKAQVESAPATGTGADLSDEDRQRLQEALREAKEARAGFEAMRTSNSELLAQSGELRDEAGKLKAEIAELRDGDGNQRHDLDDLRRQQKEIQSWLAEAREERDQARAQVLEAVARVEETRAKLQSGVMRPASQVGASGITTESGMLKALKRSKDDVEKVRRDTEAVRARLEKLAADNEVAAHRAEEARQEAAAARAEYRGDPPGGARGTGGSSRCRHPHRCRSIAAPAPSSLRSALRRASSRRSPPSHGRPATRPPRAVPTPKPPAAQPPSSRRPSPAPVIGSSRFWAMSPLRVSSPRRPRRRRSPSATWRRRQAKRRWPPWHDGRGTRPEVALRVPGRGQRSAPLAGGDGRPAVRARAATRGR